jgi:hypothetical protein
MTLNTLTPNSRGRISPSQDLACSSSLCRRANFLLSRLRCNTDHSTAWNSYDNSHLSLDRFHEYLAARGSLTEPDDPTFNPYTWRFKQDGKVVWEIMAQDPKRLKSFQMGLANMEASVPIVGFYDFGKLETSDDRSILVDVGAHPNLASKPEKFVLQDLPEQIALARAAGRLPEKVVKMEHDFYTEQPVKGQSSHLLLRFSCKFD